MTLDGSHRKKRLVQRPVIGVVAGAAVLSGMLAANVHADPANDAMAKLNELSRQAEQTTEAMHAAQLDLGKKLEVQATADKQLTDAQANITSAQAQLSMFSPPSTRSLPRCTWAGAPTAWPPSSPRNRRRG